MLAGYLSLCRISNLPSIWTNVLCSYMLAVGAFSWAGYLPIAFSLSCFYLAGMCLNDVCDADHDRHSRPSRPIPAGLVSLSGARRLTGALFVLAFASLLMPPHRQGMAGAVLLAIIIVWYDFRHKKNPLSVLLMAFCRFLTYSVTALAATGSMPLSVLGVGLLQFVYVVGLSLVARHENARATPYPFPVIPLLLAGIPVLDGIMLAILVHPAWLLAGLGGMLLLLAGQRCIRGD
jgi:4-hydroxybenzoate polyprenyltransferase